LFVMAIWSATAVRPGIAPGPDRTLTKDSSE
jgi:hypothetical protein